MTGGGGVIGANDDFDLGQNVGSSGGVGNDEVDGADALAVPEKNRHTVTLADKCVAIDWGAHMPMFLAKL